jgi:hypothetical protein
MANELDVEAQRPRFEAAMKIEGLSVDRSLPEYGGRYRFVEERWQGWLSAFRAMVAEPLPTARCLFRRKGYREWCEAEDKFIELMRGWPEFYEFCRVVPEDIAQPTSAEVTA